ncbi:hypothetical protein PAAG_03440 [Paracoccidioides lutzii Pb01]|uniref:Uncharacterized protein n=1 Tax=Paracoccidioides lutzii (strain ATCC MYA-826 / Pb01) TaxID=502779 RepID=C1GX66_PARBA|nr:hypothetical protein PAAG_03440 [Paracoccidioides lutzii Pb01]EEH41154.2 hypothetical protein PAAG_03440 [Paracoccidioides lutzii Pb01]
MTDAPSLTFPILMNLPRRNRCLRKARIQELENKEKEHEVQILMLIEERDQFRNALAWKAAGHKNPQFIAAVSEYPPGVRPSAPYPTREPTTPPHFLKTLFYAFALYNSIKFLSRTAATAFGHCTRLEDVEESWTPKHVIDLQFRQLEFQKHFFHYFHEFLILRVPSFLKRAIMAFTSSDSLQPFRAGSISSFCA